MKLRVTTLAAMFVLAMSSTTTTFADEALATKNGCMACHKVDVKVVGPALKDVAAKYKDDATAIDALSAKVKAGGKGVWGEIPMPPNAAVSDEDLKTIVSWMLSQ
jgi:cytochrome c